MERSVSRGNVIGVSDRAVWSLLSAASHSESYWYSSYLSEVRQCFSSLSMQWVEKPADSQPRQVSEFIGQLSFVDACQAVAPWSVFVLGIASGNSPIPIGERMKVRGLFLV